MSNMTMTPTIVQNAVQSLQESLLGEDSQVFWAPLGAVVLTDEAVYEVYLYDEDQIIIQQGTLEKGRGWEDVTSSVSLELPETTPLTYGDLYS